MKLVTQWLGMWSLIDLGQKQGYLIPSSQCNMATALMYSSTSHIYMACILCKYFFFCGLYANNVLYCA